MYNFFFFTTGNSNTQQSAIPPTIDEETTNTTTGNGEAGAHHAPMLQVYLKKNMLTGDSDKNMKRYNCDIYFLFVNVKCRQKV